MAVIGAFVLIALAIVARNHFADDGGGSSNGSGRPHKGGSAPVVACTPDLAAVCTALADQGSIAKDPPTLDLDGAATPDSKIDGWITWDPAPQIANFDAGQPKVWGVADALGSTSLAALAEGEVFGGLRSGCGEQVDWACFAKRWREWGMTIGVGDPTTAEGLSRLAPLAIALAPDLDTEELQPSDLRDIVTSPAIPQSDAASMSLAATQPGKITLVIGPQSLLEARANSPQGKNLRLEPRALKPTRTATVVVAPRVGRDLGDPAGACEDDAVAKALESVGVVPCSDGRDDVDRAGFLYVVREKAS